MPKNAKTNVYKEKEFRIYVLWKSLPAHFRGMEKNELKSLGFTDPLVLKIIKIKNQTEFAKYFHIKDLGTLTDWNNRIKKNNIASPLSTTDFQKQCSSINQQIILPSIDELKKEILKQNEMVSLLEKENNLLKKKLMILSSHVKNRTTEPRVTKLQEIVPRAKPKINHPEISRSIPKMNDLAPQRNKNIFQKIKKAWLQ